MHVVVYTGMYVFISISISKLECKRAKTALEYRPNEALSKK